MTWILSKISKPGWVKEFDKQEDAEEELYKYNCKDCRELINDNIEDLIETACSCEFILEEA